MATGQAFDTVLNSLNFDNVSAVIFVILMGIFLYAKRKDLNIQRIISLPKSLGQFPILYILLLRTKWGIRFMEKMSTKYREPVKLFGYICIGVGFIGMAIAALMMILTLFLIIFRPQVENTGAVLLLPFTTIPGFGYLSFWHFLIALFIIATIHEFAHGVVAKAHGLKVKSSGIASLGLGIPLIPMAFVEPDEKKLREQPDVVQYSVFAAGPGINLFTAFVVYMIFLFVFVPIESNMIESKGFSFDLINETYPASASGMPPTTINMLNGENITDFWDFQDKMACVGPGEEITLGTENGTYVMTTTASPDDESQGFIGIRPVQNEIALRSEYQGISMPFFWLKGLIQWLYRLNFFVGIFNLLPLVIVDGGRMFQIAVGKTVKSKVLQNRIIGYFATFFLIIMLIAFLKTYAPFLFS